MKLQNATGVILDKIFSCISLVEKVGPFQGGKLRFPSRKTWQANNSCFRPATFTAAPSGAADYAGKLFFFVELSCRPLSAARFLLFPAVWFR
ncbi:hypothetical protein V1T76_08225 [Roseibium sp. FZY0029]|uniref:hypothetical protein n=1 Tax=Roseibium sp. FZY0029 TaxID=3116647 RepID=UPI002EA453D5|nr:hypothetical protein [Roseibium sp. FZY0029]